MGGLGITLALLLAALAPVFAHAAEAGERPEGEQEDDCRACGARNADPDGGHEDWSWPSWTPAPRVIA